MKKTIALLLIVASLGFALPTLQGTRGTNFVSSALCEDMGYLWFYMAAEGYKERVIFQDSAGITVQDTFNNMAAKPIVSIGFTPWHYLEFSVYGSAYYYMNSDNSVSAFGLSDVGGHVKGSIPFSPLDNPTVLALGIDGFFLMSLPFELDAAANLAMEQYLGYYPFDQAGPEFGGSLLFSFTSQYISSHVNAGYWYRSLHTLGATTVQYPQTIISGLGIESSPWPWLNAFADFNLNYPLAMGATIDPALAGMSTHASLGARFPILMGKNKGFGLLFTLAGGADPMHFGESMSLYAGIGIGGDLIQPKEKLVEGLVTDAETGEPIDSARIELAGDLIDTTVYSDSTGRFVLPELVEGDEINVTKDGYHPETVSAEEVGEELTLTLDMDPIKESFIAGVVSDKETSEPVLAVITFNNIETGEVLPSVTSDAVTGYFRVKIEPAIYRMKTSAPEYNDDFTSVTIDTSDNKIVDVFLIPIEVEVPEPVELEPVTVTGFGRGQTSLGYEQMARLEEVIEILEANPDATVVIIGHTDSIGSDSSNLSVGRRRAESVGQYLLIKGVKPGRMDLGTGGERYPIGDTRYRAARKANRRVEITFYNGDEGGKGNGNGSGGGKPPRERVK